MTNPFSIRDKFLNNILRVQLDFETIIYLTLHAKNKLAITYHFRYLFQCSKITASYMGWMSVLIKFILKLVSLNFSCSVLAVRPVRVRGRADQHGLPHDGALGLQWTEPGLWPRQRLLLDRQLRICTDWMGSEWEWDKWGPEWGEAWPRLCSVTLRIQLINWCALQLQSLMLFLYIRRFSYISKWMRFILRCDKYSIRGKCETCYELIHGLIVMKGLRFNSEHNIRIFLKIPEYLLIKVVTYLSNIQSVSFCWSSVITVFLYLLIWAFVIA